MPGTDVHLEAIKSLPPAPRYTYYVATHNSTTDDHTPDLYKRRDVQAFVAMKQKTRPPNL